MYIVSFTSSISTSFAQAQISDRRIFLDIARMPCWGSACSSGPHRSILFSFNSKPKQTTSNFKVQLAKASMSVSCGRLRASIQMVHYDLKWNNRGR